MVDSLHKRGRHHGNKLTITRPTSYVAKDTNKKRKKGEFQPWCYRDENGNPVTNEQGNYVLPEKRTKVKKATASKVETDLRKQVEDLQKELALVKVSFVHHVCVHFLHQN
jgi:hypothetical protein